MKPAAALLLLLGACGPHSAISPRGEAAAEIAQLWWILFVVTVIITIISLALLVVAIRRRRDDWQRPTAADDRIPTRWIIFGGIIAPAFVIVFLLIVTLDTLGALAPVDDDPWTIEVTGVQWWWDVEYRFGQSAPSVRTANEIHIPTGQRVQLVLGSRDVIHSFWVPALHGKLDLIPGRQNRIWIHADQPGVYRGQCAEFCGVQHAHMALYVVAHEPAEFERWLRAQRQPGAEPMTALQRHGRDVFLSRCIVCHAVRGTPARATVGPDLTHVGSRLTLAAGTLPNTRGHLGGWIANPQRMKPGNYMPRVMLNARELQGLMHYLESLK